MNLIIFDLIILFKKCNWNLIVGSLSILGNRSHFVPSKSAARKTRVSPENNSPRPENEAKPWSFPYSNFSSRLWRLSSSPSRSGSLSRIIRPEIRTPLGWKTTRTSESRSTSLESFSSAAASTPFSTKVRNIENVVTTFRLFRSAESEIITDRRSKLFQAVLNLIYCSYITWILDFLHINFIRILDIEINFELFTNLLSVHLESCKKT